MTQHDDIRVFGDISRETLDRSDRVDYADMAIPGIHESVIRQISLANKEPSWMLDLRLRSFEIFKKFAKPTW
jgi:Fe-S cluster assembly protein SufB